MTAIEATGVVDEHHQLCLDGPLPIFAPSRVRVIVLVPEATDVAEPAWLKSAAANSAFEFLKAEAEDIYSRTDGRPFHDQG